MIPQPGSKGPSASVAVARGDPFQYDDLTPGPWRPVFFGAPFRETAEGSGPGWGALAPRGRSS